MALPYDFKMVNIAMSASHFVRLNNIALHVHTSELRDVICRLPYAITQCYLPPNTSERAPPNHSQNGWCPINLPQRDGRLSWPRWLVIPRWFTRPQTVTHPSTNRARRRVTALIKTNALPLSQLFTLYIVSEKKHVSDYIFCSNWTISVQLK